MTSPQGSQLDTRSVDMWQRSHLAELPVEACSAMLAGSFVVTIPAGSPIGQPNGPATLALIHSGLTRVELTGPDGRTATVRYAGAGQVLGLTSAIAGTSPWAAYAISDCEVTVLDPAILRRLAADNSRVAWGLARQMARIVHEVVDTLGANVFGSIEQRVCRHLLELAVRRPAGLVVLADQHEIAQSVGSVREVVARTLRMLREKGAVQRLSKGGMLIIRPDVLHEIAFGEDDDTH